MAETMGWPCAPEEELHGWLRGNVELNQSGFKFPLGCGNTLGDGNGKPLLEHLTYLESPITVAGSQNQFDSTKQQVFLHFKI